MPFKKVIIVGIAGICLTACRGEETMNIDVDVPGVSKTVARHNVSVERQLDFADKSDFEAAKRGFIASLEREVITKADGSPVYDFEGYGFLNQLAPYTANPSLWRQSQLNALHGLFEVTPGIYQVRGFDLSNITFIRSDHGWIVVDPLISAESAAAAKRLVDRELGVQPIQAVMFTHSHLDHYGGVRGLFDGKDAPIGVDIIAPEGFTRETVSENILVGNAMGRRASYMFGSLLPKNATGQIGSGLGQAVSSGSPGMIRPTREIKETGETIRLDGVDIEFIMTHDAEAPTEFMFYLPKWNAFCQAEIINHTFHNLLTLRGAKVRNGRNWSKYIDQAIVMYGDKTEVSFGSHHWPTWGRGNIIPFWEGQRDLYRYVHDQTLRLANHGFTMHEIPPLLDVPDGISKRFANRDYYGTVSHNSKAQYQLYLGYFDGNPANLDPLPPVEESRKFVAYMGGADPILAKARTDYENGEFRFVATVLQKLVFAEPWNTDASDLLAKTYRQLGYMAESGPWRNFYLTGAQELEQGITDLPAIRTNSRDMVKSVPLDLYFDLLAMRLDGPKVAKKKQTFNFEITDTGEVAVLILSNGTLHHRMNTRDDEATASLKITRAGFDKLNLGEASFQELTAAGEASIDGKALAFAGLMGALDEFPFWFEIVRP